MLSFLAGRCMMRDTVPCHHHLTTEDHRYNPYYEFYPIKGNIGAENGIPINKTCEIMWRPVIDASVCEQQQPGGRWIISRHSAAEEVLIEQVAKQEPQCRSGTF